MGVTQRFSNRVENYVKYRPSYPAAMIDHIVARAELRDGASVADIGSGTGIFTSLILARGLRVYGVEPNREMREAAERQADAGVAVVAARAGRSRHLVGEPMLLGVARLQLVDRRIGALRLAVSLRSVP